MTAYRFTLAELSGALADLGVMLPLVLALITLNGVDATGAFVGIGLAYLVTALAYRLPIPVQPLKSVSAVALALGLSARIVVAAAWWNAALFLLMAWTRADRLIARLFPRPVVRGIQLGLAVLLGRSAWSLISASDAVWPGDVIIAGATIPWVWLIGAGTLTVLLLALRWWPDWAGLAAILFGVTLAVIHNGLPSSSFTFSLPALASVIPHQSELWQALWLLAVPQIPLSLANSVFATADAARQYFGVQAGHVSPRRLMTTMGINNTLVALVGGVPVCHGCGGLTAHYRLGARTRGAPLMLGVGFLALGVLGGETLLPLLRLIPFPTLGVLLAYVGFQHMLLARDLRGWREWSPALLIALITFHTGNLAIGAALGIVIHFGIRGLNTMSAHLRLRGATNEGID
ncbi:MAG TPA: putative sulfate/molybdate transporter [Anaerolineae bacterium]|nr:putative sulfate/molybdate transporter [Anaerolineae bacterium]